MAEPVFPTVSVVIPCRNERDHIGPCLESILQGDYPAERREIVVVDGMSDDGTRERVRQLAALHPGLRLVDNPARVTPAALNLGIAQTRGEIVVRMDAHVRYPPDYIRRLVTAQQETGAHNVGGVLRTLPGGPGPVAEAIALAQAHWFGVGNARFRIGAGRPSWVDTVPFGCFRRSLLERLGGFDPELVRNQDDELNGRIIRAGGRILLLPNVIVDYFARRSLAGLARAYFQYGYYKPLVVRKLGAVPTVRQLAPAGLILAGAAAALLLWLAPPEGRALLAALAGAYGVGLLAGAGDAWRRTRRPAALLLPLVFPMLHFPYGWGYLCGLPLALRRRAYPRVADVSVTR